MGRDIHVVFQMLPKHNTTLFRSTTIMPKHLAYVEWFSPFALNPGNNHGMYAITRSLKDGKRLASVIPVSDIARTVVLFPKFGPLTPREWTCNNVLDECTTFYVNPFTDRHSYLSLY